MNLPNSRTPEQLRAIADQQFSFIVEQHDMLNLTQLQAKEQVRLGRLILDHVFTMPAGTVLDWKSALPAEPAGIEATRLVFGVMPFIATSLDLLDIEFTHAHAGVVPLNLVSQLMSDATEPVSLNGVTLTSDSVHLQFRRSA